LSFTQLCNQENSNDLNELNINATYLSNRIKEFASDDFYTKQIESLTKPNKFLADEYLNIRNFSEIKPDNKIFVEDLNKSGLNSFLGHNREESLSKNKLILTENKENTLNEKNSLERKKKYESESNNEIKNRLFPNWEYLERPDEKKNLSLLDSFRDLLKSPQRKSDFKLLDESENKRDINRLLDFKTNESNKLELIQNARSKVERQFELISKRSRDSNRSYGFIKLFLLLILGISAKNKTFH
jgi:hypothetical protein